MPNCNICNKSLNSWDLYNFRGESLCSDCYKKTIYSCGVCNGTFDNRKIPHSNKKLSGSYICPQCLKYATSKCEHCKKLHFQFQKYKNKSFCLQCISDALHDYHHSQSSYPFYAHRSTGNYKTKRGANGDLYFGIELETDRAEHNADFRFPLIEIKDMLNNEVYFETDCSLGTNGAELITYPHTEDAFYSLDWKGALEHMRKCGRQSHNSGRCGLHQHINKKYFGDTVEEQNENIAKVLMFYHLCWDDIVKFSRRVSTTYCRKVDLEQDGYHRYEKTDDKNKNMQNFAKYRVDRRITGHSDAINLSNRETIEFRIMRGTLKYETFMACIDFNLCVAKRAKEITWEQAGDYKEWLKNISENTLNYCKQRKCFKDLYTEEPEVIEISNGEGDDN